MKFLFNIYFWYKCYTCSYQEALRIGHVLNTWKWPFKYFSNYYSKFPKYHPKSGVTKQSLMRSQFNYIQKKTTYYDQMYYHNVTMGSMSVPEIKVFISTPLTEKEYNEMFNYLKQLSETEKIQLN